MKVHLTYWVEKAEQHSYSVALARSATQVIFSFLFSSAVVQFHSCIIWKHFILFEIAGTTRLLHLECMKTNQ